MDKTVLLRGSARDIVEACNHLKITYRYDSGDYYIREFDYNRDKNSLAYYGVY